MLINLDADIDSHRNLYIRDGTTPILTWRYKIP